VDPHGLPCSCGSRGCLETMASGPAIAGEAVRIMLSGNAPHLLQLCGGQASLITPALAGQSKDVAIQASIATAGRWIGLAAANLVSALHPQLVVLGGGVAQLGSKLVEPVAQELHARVGMFPTTDVQVKVSQLGDKAGLLGGIALAARGPEFIPQLLNL
jgi:glucokinase